MMIHYKDSGEAGEETNDHRQKTSEMRFCMITAAGSLESVETENKNRCWDELPQQKSDQKQQGRRPDRIDRDVKAIDIDIPIIFWNATFSD